MFHHVYKFLKAWSIYPSQQLIFSCIYFLLLSNTRDLLDHKALSSLIHLLLPPAARERNTIAKAASKTWRKTPWKKEPQREWLFTRSGCVDPSFELIRFISTSLRVSYLSSSSYDTGFETPIIWTFLPLKLFLLLKFLGWEMICLLSLGIVSFESRVHSFLWLIETSYLHAWKYIMVQETVIMLWESQRNSLYFKRC